jgi:hypothetical protein
MRKKNILEIRRRLKESAKMDYKGAGCVVLVILDDLV